MNSPLVHRALVTLADNYGRIHVRAQIDGDYQTVALADLEDEQALEWVCALLRRYVEDEEPIRVSQGLTDRNRGRAD